ncbi:hypothetical protein ABT093_06145 [Kitasatospora sp. NPDC002551]|uniref:hypothetical protein n=1 Tax=Kitasatospora sp. NPDC002551 TaxID=3154539 RepID=UPI0033297E7F
MTDFEICQHRDAAPRRRPPRRRGRRADGAAHNLRLVEAPPAVAADRIATVAQLATARVAPRRENLVPLVGARRRDRPAEALGAPDVPLTEADLPAVKTAVPAGSATGERYAAARMAHLDSER